MSYHFILGLGGLQASAVAFTMLEGFINCEFGVLVGVCNTHISHVFRVGSNLQATFVFGYMPSLVYVDLGSCVPVVIFISLLILATSGLCDMSVGLIQLLLIHRVALCILTDKS